MTIDVDKYRSRLQSISVLDNVLWKRSTLLSDAEEGYEETVARTFGGFLDLTNASNCFFLETVERINTECRPHVRTPLSEFYPLFVTRLVQNFRSLCGTQRLALSGYPLPAFTILRNTFDDAVLTSACLQSVSDFYSIEGITPGVKVDRKEVKKLKLKTDFEVRDKFIGRKSGLSASTIDELAKWDSLFDFEVHGARLSLTSTTGWLRGTQPLNILPVFNKQEFTMYMNRACEIGWMVHRLIPVIQPPSVPLADDWKNKWNVIDESYRQSVEALSAEHGKPIGNAISEFVSAKFPFNCNTEFPLR